MTSRADVVVAGGGAIGSVIALLLARASVRVIVVDPEPLGENASGVAAGMLAPAFEALFDEASHRHFPLLREARDQWPSLADSLGLALDREGALAVGARSQVTEWASALDGFGGDARMLTPAETAAATPWLAGGWAVMTADDWRLEPLPALLALRREAERLGARWTRGRVVGRAEGQVALAGGDAVVAGALILASGASTSLAALAPELRRISPVKGQILRAAWPSQRLGPVLRGAGVYVCPAPGELILGASMEPGRGDLGIDPRIVADLIERASQLSPGLRDLDWGAKAGVRAETPDGLPLVGHASTPNVLLAVGARRNGWLLAPLIAAIVADLVAGRAPPPKAGLFDPARLAVSRAG